MVALPITCSMCGAHNYHYGYCRCGVGFRGFVAPQFAMSWERMVALAALYVCVFQTVHPEDVYRMANRNWSAIAAQKHVFQKEGGK